MSQTTFNFNFIYLHFCAFHTREEGSGRGREEGGEVGRQVGGRQPAPMQLQLRHCRRTKNVAHPEKPSPNPFALPRLALEN